MRHPYRCFCFLGTSWGFFKFEFWFWKFKNLIFNQNIHFWGVYFLKKFWLVASSQVFLIFWNFRGSFLSLIFGFWKFWNCIFNQNSHFWGGLFYETFWFEASLSTSDDFIDSSGIIFLVPFLATKETLAPLANDPIM